MLGLYGIAQNKLVPVSDPKEAAWIDLFNPTREEEEAVEKHLGIEVPTPDEMAEIEISSRLYREDDNIFLTATVMTGADTSSPAARPVSFILTRSHLITVRYAEPTPFKTYVKTARATGTELSGADAIFVGLMEAIVDRAADILERVAVDMDNISDAVFHDDDSGAANNRYKTVLRRIGKSGDLNSKVRESLVSLGRLLNYLGGECRTERAELRGHTDLIAADIRSLTDHSTYLAGKMTFVLDATLGLINTEQNLIIKVVSVVSVTLMPPTLIASTYGMNFAHMPELSWPFGYPLALIAMLVAAIAPYLAFRWKGWL